MAVLPVDYTNRNNALINGVAADEASRVAEAPPIEPAAAVQAVQPAQPIGVQDEIRQNPIDAEISSEARRLADRADDVQARSIDYRESGFTPASTQSMRELVASFEGYDNSAAVNTYNNYLNAYSRYGDSMDDARQDMAALSVRGLETAAYRYYGIISLEQSDRMVRERMGNAIDGWLAGSNVFTPVMLGYSSSLGFRFTPLSQQAQRAIRAPEIRSTFEQERLAEYLREMGRLTPDDFIFYDPTNLGDLTLEDRRAVLRQVQEAIDERRLELRAADLRYTLREDRLEIEALDEEFDDEQALREVEETLWDERNTYFGNLRFIIQQYNAGIISDALG